MPRRNKNKKDRPEDFIRYLGNRMDESERNDFERNLQKDPFAEEAMEGFEGTDPVSAINDIRDLKRRLRRRVSLKIRIIWFRMAASLALFVIIGSVIYLSTRNRNDIQLAMAPSSEPLEIIKVPPVKANPDVIIPEVNPALKYPGESAGAGIKVQDEKPGDTGQKDLAVAQEKDAVAEEVSKAQKIDEVRIADAGVSEDARAEAPLTRKALAKTSGEDIQVVRGKVISSYDSRPIPGVSINIKGTNKGTVSDSGGNFRLNAAETRGRVLVASHAGMVSQEFSVVSDSIMKIKLTPSSSALTEVVVVGYDAPVETRGSGYIPPRPVTGMEDFGKYIEQNLIRPDSSTDGQRAVVVLSFRVGSNGTIDSINVVRSPGKLFSDEALRVFQQGPAWMPAEREGKPVDEVVRIRIVFW